MKRFFSAFPILCTLGLGLIHVPSAQAVGTRRVALRSGDDFSSGQLQGVAIDAAGKVRAGLNLGNIPVADATTVWSVLRTRRGVTLLGTGNEGRLFELSNGAVKEVAKAEALALTTMVEAWGGAVIIGSLPGGTLYEYKNGKLTEWLQLEDVEHIFQMAYDARAQALYVATGPKGQLLRVTKDKRAQVHFDAEEEHLVSVAVGNGVVYAGGGDKAKLYSIEGPGRGSVLYDFGRTEVRAIAVARSGDVYAIANEMKTKRSLPSSSSGESAKPKQSSSSKPSGKGTLYRFDRNGTPEQLLDDKQEHFTSLALDDEGVPYVGTGSEGKLYSIDDNRNSVLAADTEERQLTGLLMSGKDRFVFASDPLVVHPVRGTGGQESVWTSQVIDAGLRARFGRLDWVAQGQVEMSTRSGNSEEPDDTWSEWSQPLTEAGDIKSPRARFFQVRARFSRDPNAVLSEVIVPFVTDNLRAVITSIEFENAASRALSGPDDSLSSSGGPISGKADDEIDIEWQVDNPDKDQLRYWLQYRMEGTSDWFDILKPMERLTKSSYSWETADLPEGRYRVRVKASDSLANPPGLATEHLLVSHVVLVDNTPPEVEGLAVTGRVLTGTAVDGVGPISRVEVAVAGTDEWFPVAATDGVFDEQREAFSVDLSSVVPSGSALLTVRVYDEERNRVVRSIMLR